MQWVIDRYRHARRSGQEGWVLMDAIWSSVVVALAFMSTFLAIDASTKTATRDIRKSTAYDLAQNELDRLRKIGDTNLPNLLAADNTATPPASPSRTVVLDGVTYTIWDRAYYVENIGTDVTDACGNAASAGNGSTPQYVYIKTTVYWQGLNTTASKPAELDAYFAPEGGDLQSNTGTLRVFVQTMSGTPIAGKSVTLNRLPANVTISGSPTTTGATGCVLFTGLARSKYEITIPTSTEYDLYMTTNPIKVPIMITSRATLSRTIKIGQPVTVVPSFVTDGGTGSTTVTAGASTNSFIGPWMAASPEITSASGNEFMASPGMTFMPHQTAAIANKMFALDTGYTAFAGPCDINDPGAANRVVMGNTIDPSWVPGGTYVGPRALRVPNFRVRLLRTADNAIADTGMVQVMLVDRVGSTAGAGSCGARTNLFETWVRLPGKVDTEGYLTVPAYALPTGRYEICARQTIHRYYDPPGTSPLGWYDDILYLHLTNRDNTYPGPNAISANTASGTTTGDTECNLSIGNWT